MKNKLYIILILAVTLLGCDDYLDINDNPNGAIKPPIKGLLSNVTYNSAINVYRVGSTTSFYTQYLASPNQASTTDIHERISTNGIWSNIYNISSDITDMIKFAESNSSYHYVGVGKTLLALNIGMAVDVYGNIPYTEAFDFKTVTPSYDNDKDLYQKVITLLDEAIVEFNKDNDGENLVASNDFIHGGNIGAWIKTANALKARYLNHMSNTPDYNSTNVLSALDDAYSSNDDDAQLSRFKNRSPWGQVASNNAGLILGGWLSEQLIDAMNGTTFGVFDPRLPLITNPLPNNTYVGTENGVGRTGDGTVQNEVYLTTNDYYSSSDSPLFIITYAETEFIKAEAKFRSGDTSGAYEAYLSGIRSHMEKMGVAETDITSYLSNTAVADGASNLTLKDIFKEKYIALFLNPESWVDMRRNNYDYTDFTIPENHNSELGGQFLRRFDYPDSEYQRNGSNVPEVNLLTKIWWDQ